MHDLLVKRIEAGREFASSNVHLRQRVYHCHAYIGLADGVCIVRLQSQRATKAQAVQEGIYLLTTTGEAVSRSTMCTCNYIHSTTVRLRAEAISHRVIGGWIV